MNTLIVHCKWLLSTSWLLSKPRRHPLEHYLFIHCFLSSQSWIWCCIMTDIHSQLFKKTFKKQWNKCLYKKQSHTRIYIYIYTNGLESARCYIIFVPRRNNQKNFSDVESKPGTLFFSVAGDCHNMAGTLCIAHPIKIFSLNVVNCSLLIRPNPSLFLLTYLIVIQ